MGLISKWLDPESKVRPKKYFTTGDYFEIQREMQQAERVINKYGDSLVKNEGFVVFRQSTLPMQKRGIEINFKKYAEGCIRYNMMGSSLENLLAQNYGSLGLFVKDSISDRINLDFKLYGEAIKNNKPYDEEKYKKLIEEIQHYNFEKLRKMSYFEQYIEALKKKISWIMRMERQILNCLLLYYLRH